MKQGLLEKIKSRGYWRVNFQPVTVEYFETQKELREIIEKNSLSVRGWDYPHIPRRNDENGSMLSADKYLEGWEEWEKYKEFWRIYKSGQFLYYRGLREDWIEEDTWYGATDTEIKQIKPLTRLAMLGSVIYEVTEMFEFLSRLVKHGLYRDGVVVNISLHNTEGRQLWVDSSNRLPFSFPKKTGAREIPFSGTFSKEEIIENSNTIANKLILQVFDAFEFNPSSDQIMKDQESFLSRRF